MKRYKVQPFEPHEWLKAIDDAFSPPPFFKIRGERSLAKLAQLAAEAGGNLVAIEIDLPPKKTAGLISVQGVDTDFGFVEIRRVGK